MIKTYGIYDLIKMVINKKNTCLEKDVIDFFSRFSYFKKYNEDENFVYYICDIDCMSGDDLDEFNKIWDEFGDAEDGSYFVNETTGGDQGTVWQGAGSFDVQKVKAIDIPNTVWNNADGMYFMAFTDSDDFDLIKSIDKELLDEFDFDKKVMDIIKGKDGNAYFYPGEAFSWYNSEKVEKFKVWLAKMNEAGKKYNVTFSIADESFYNTEPLFDDQDEFTVEFADNECKSFLTLELNKGSKVNDIVEKFIPNNKDCKM